MLYDAGLPGKTGRAFRKGSGCAQCHDSGCKGRMGVYEVMEITPDLRRLVHAAAPSHVMREKMTQAGIKTLREEGVLLALDGKCSLEEVLSVTHSEEVDPTDQADSPKVAA